MRMTHSEFFDSLRMLGPLRVISQYAEAARPARARRGGALVKASFLLTLALAVTASAAEPVRVATLLPYVEDALRRTGGVEIVASVRRDLTTAPKPPIVDLGSPHAPSFEKLAEARPQVIVGDRQLHGSLRDKLAVGGAEVVLVGAESVDATFDGLLEVGRRCGVEAPMAAQVDSARRAIPAFALAQRTPALIVFGTPGSFLVVSDRTWLGDLVTRLNFDNLGASASGDQRHPGFVQVSDEVLAGLRPEVVLMVAHGEPEAIRAAFTKRLDGSGPWAGIRAAAVRGVHVLPPALFSQNPGLDVPEAAKVLHDIGAARTSTR
jgi:iron complex transport system substrate-binding protein